MKKIKNKHYLTNPQLLEEIIKCKENGKPSNKFMQMMILLTDKIAKKPNFVNYTYIEDMQSNALLAIVKYWNNFDAEKSDNPFAYFTTIIINAFIQVLNSEENHRNIRDAICVQNGMDPSFAFLETDQESYNY